MKKKAELLNNNYVRISGVGKYLGKLELFNKYCKVLIDGRVLTLPVEMITHLGENNATTDKETWGSSYDWGRHRSLGTEHKQGASTARI